MKVIKLIGGLGNQMFQYALYKSFESKGVKVYLDDFVYFEHEHCPPHSAYHLDVFNVKYNSIRRNYFYSFKLLAETYFRRYGFEIQLVDTYTEKEVCLYDSDVFNIRSSYILGYWQTSKYFEDIREVIKQDFTYKGPWTQKNSIYRDKMLSCESVCVHIRRGDYLKAANIYGGICTEDYYKKSIKLIKDKVDKPRFFIFSNDLEWCKAFFENEDYVVFVEGNDDAYSYMDMILMTYCKHHIIANSSFSWWGAWLSKEDGITVAPDKWLNTHKTPDIWCEDWIKI